MSRKELRRLVAQRAEASEEICALFEAERAELAARVREYKPRWRGDDMEIVRKALSKLETWEAYALLRPVRESLMARYRAARTEKKWTERCIEVVARELRPRPGDSWRIYRVVSGSTFHTQGFGADSYARGRAEIEAVELNVSTGIECRVVKVELPRPKHHGPFYVHTSNWHVEARVAEDLDLEIMRHAPAPSLRDFVKACWSRGLNPRVYDPFLPHGLEERLGVDYQGRDVEK